MEGGDFVMRSTNLLSELQQDIVRPEFFDILGGWIGIEVTQGTWWDERTHYNYEDQFICMIEGSAKLRLVPHIDWNLLYFGQAVPDRFSREKTVLKKNQSPVNLFQPNLDAYPKV